MPFYSFRTLGGDLYGSFEVFSPPEEGPERWFWQPCWPGCLPDGEPHGPYASAKEAYEDAMGDEDSPAEAASLLAQIFGSYVPRG